MNKVAMHASRTKQQGFSIIELMVALAINMVIVTAAAYLYLGTSQSRRELDQARELKDNGQYALDLIGRDVVNAGFYPVISLGASKLPEGYKNGLSGTQAGLGNFNNPVFGCDGQAFDIAGTDVSSLYTCKNHTNVDTRSDSLVVSYYTNDAFGPDTGHVRDCTGATISTAVAGTPLAAPAFVANRYMLTPVATSIENIPVNTWSLSCGSAVASGNRSDQPAVVGIEQLRFRYSVYEDDETLKPSQFYTATEMNALGTLAVKTPLSAAEVSLGPWGRVVAIEVCIVARAMLPTKQSGETNADYTYTDCSNDEQTATDRVRRQTHRKVYAVRNNLTLAVSPPAS